MSHEEDIKKELENKFNYLKDKIVIKRPRRIFAEVDLANFYEVLDYGAKKMHFNRLATITGLDEGEKIGLIYHLSQDSGVLLNIHTAVLKTNPVIKTVLSYYPIAEIYERELIDLLGVKVEGMPSGQRYPFPDNWPEGQYPLRKDWKADSLKDWKPEMNLERGIF